MFTHREFTLQPVLLELPAGPLPTLLGSAVREVHASRGTHLCRKCRLCMAASPAAISHASLCSSLVCASPRAGSGSPPRRYAFRSPCGNQPRSVSREDRGNKRASPHTPQLTERLRLLIGNYFDLSLIKNNLTLNKCEITKKQFQPNTSKVEKTLFSF